MLMPQADALAQRNLRRTSPTLLLVLMAGLGLGCVDITPRWEKAGWRAPDSGTSLTPDTAEPAAPDSGVVADTEPPTPPEPSVDAAKDQRLDSDRVDAQADTRPTDPDTQADVQPQDGRSDLSVDAWKPDGEDALPKTDQRPDVDSLVRDTRTADLSPDELTPLGDAGPEALPTQGLVAHYPCESANGSTLPDRSGNRRNATLANGSGGSTPVGFTFAPGKVDNGMRLNPADKAYVSLPRGIVSQLKQLTIATWVKLNTSTAFQRIFDFGSDTNTFMYLTNSGDTGVRFRISSSNGKNQVVEGGAALPVGTWTHVALTLGDDGISLFLNGSQVAKQAPAALRASDLGDTGNNYVGRSQFAADPYLDGMIDEFRIYDRVLGASEITDLASGR
jgi:hypothetical protein